MIFPVLLAIIPTVHYSKSEIKARLRKNPYNFNILYNFRDVKLEGFYLYGTSSAKLAPLINEVSVFKVNRALPPGRRPLWAGGRGVALRCEPEAMAGQYSLRGVGPTGRRPIGVEPQSS